MFRNRSACILAHKNVSAVASILVAVKEIHQGAHEWPDNEHVIQQDQGGLAAQKTSYGPVCLLQQPGFAVLRQEEDEAFGTVHAS